MTVQDIDSWILENTQAGHSFETLLSRLVGSGWPQGTAVEALEKVLGKPPVPAYSVEERGRRITVHGHPIEIVMTMQSPPVTLFRHLLSAVDTRHELGNMRNLDPSNPLTFDGAKYGHCNDWWHGERDDWTGDAGGSGAWATIRTEEI